MDGLVKTVPNAFAMIMATDVIPYATEKKVGHLLDSVPAATGLTMMIVVAALGVQVGKEYVVLPRVDEQEIKSHDSTTAHLAKVRFVLTESALRNVERA